MFRQAASYSKYLLQAKPFTGLTNEKFSNKLEKLFDKNRVFYAFIALDVVRKKNSADERVLRVNDLGAGSKSSKSNMRSVQSILRSAVKEKKYAELMFRLVEAFQPQTIIELGTSLGITTGYLSKASKSSRVYTLEGAEEIVNVAKENFQLMKLQNVELIEGDFDDTLKGCLENLNSIDLAYLDGNHRKEATIRYFEWMLPKLTVNSIIVVDDINWSSEMNEAWKELANRKEVTLAVNLFQMGILFLSPDLKKEEILVRY